MLSSGIFHTLIWFFKMLPFLSRINLILLNLILKLCEANIIIEPVSVNQKQNLADCLQLIFEHFLVFTIYVFRF